MMKSTKFLAIILILGIISIILIISNSNTTFKRALSNFAIDDSTNVTKIFMSDKNNNNLTLSRKLGGPWVVDNKYSGSKANIELLLGTMLHIQMKETVPKATIPNVIKDLATFSVKVEVYQWKYRINIFNFIRLFPRETLTKVYYVGGPIQSNQGSYMIMEHSSVPFVVYLPGLRGFPTPIYSPIEKYWRDYTIFKKTIQQIASIRMEFPTDPVNSFEVRNNGNMHLQFISLNDNRMVQRFDTLKVMSFLSAFRNINFEALLTDMDQHRKDSILNLAPYCIISLTDTANNTNTIRIFRKGAGIGEVDDLGRPAPYDLDRLYALVNEGKDLTLIQYFVFDKILRPKSFFTEAQTQKKK